MPKMIENLKEKIAVLGSEIRALRNQAFLCGFLAGVLLTVVVHAIIFTVAFADGQLP